MNVGSGQVIRLLEAVGEVNAENRGDFYSAVESNVDHLARTDSRCSHALRAFLDPSDQTDHRTAGCRELRNFDMPPAPVPADQDRKEQKQPEQGKQGTQGPGGDWPSRIRLTTMLPTSRISKRSPRMSSSSAPARFSVPRISHSSPLARLPKRGGSWRHDMETGHARDATAGKSEPW